jgi:nucleoside-diphosphate-sugar epimerase
MTTTPLHVIAGAGPVGRTLARQLTSAGQRVRMVTRSGGGADITGVAAVRADVTDAAAAIAATEGAAVIYGAAQPAYTKWPGQFPPIQHGLLAAAAKHDAVYVAVENTYMYGEVSGPLTEDLPYAATGRKGRVRAAMAQELHDAHRRGDVRTTAGRASDFFGPDVLTSSVGERFFGPLLAGRRVSMAGDVRTPHTYTYVEDFARALITLGGDERAYGRAWHVPSAPTLSTSEFFEIARDVAGTSAKLGSVPSVVLRGLGLFVPVVREVAEQLYEFEQPHVLDHSAYTSVFGGQPTPHREALERTIAWYRAPRATTTA